MTHFLVFGTHPKLSLAEACAVLKPSQTPIAVDKVALFDAVAMEPAQLMDQLGGTVKLGRILGTIPLASCSAASIAEILAPHLPEGKIYFGFSVHAGTKEQRERLAKLPMPLKKIWTEQGRSVRWVTSERGGEIAPAAIHKLDIATEGLDINAILHQNIVHIGVTSQSQNPDHWSRRDYGRPARDTKNGMLPPKLARILVNLAQVPENGVLLDPFCGGGTIGMEAALGTSASKILESDLEPTQIQAARQNEAWLLAQGILRSEDASRFQTFVSDVRTLKGHLLPKSVDAVATEGWLGPALTGREGSEELAKNAQSVTKLWQDTLRALHPILKPGGHIAGIWPSFQSTKGRAFVDLTPFLNDFGYTMESPTNCPILPPWEYHRPEQFVTRKIFLLKKT